MANLVRSLVIAIGSSPIWGTLLWHTWELSIRPRLIPVGEVEALTDELIAKYGSRAEEMAFAEEDRAWRSSDDFQQGRWHRVRRELWRRYEAGEGMGRWMKEESTFRH